MKRVWILFLFSILLVLPLASSASINLPSDTFSQQETVVALVSGSFLDTITTNNIYFYRGYVRASFNYNVAKIGNNYYIYFQAGTNPNNYTMSIENVRYMNGSSISTEAIQKNFTINSNTAKFSFNPDSLVNNGNFSLAIQGFNDNPLTISIQTNVNSGSIGSFDFYYGINKVGDSFTLNPYDSSTLYVYSKNVNETSVITLILSSDSENYQIPVYIIAQNQTQIYTNTTINETDNSTIINDTNNTLPYNTTNSTVPEDNCSFFDKLFGTCNQNVDNSTIITENQTQNIINETNNTSSNNVTNDTTSGYQTTTNGQGGTALIKDGVVIEQDVSLKSCAQLNGSVCAVGDEICSGTFVDAKDNKCCIGSCVTKQRSSNKFLGWIIIGIIILWMLWFFKSKFSRTKNKKVNLLDVAKSRRR